MKPQDDFNKWCSNFKFELENEKNYSSFYPDCEELINQYIQKGSLNPPIEKKSNTFVEKSIPTFTKLVLKFKSLSKEMIDANINYVSKVISLMTYRVINGKLEEGEWITDILNPKLDLYNRPKLGQFQRLCQLYISNGDYQKLLDRASSDNPDFQHLLLIYHIRKNIESYVDMPITQLLPVLYKFITHFKDDVSLRTVDTAKLSKIVNKEILANLEENDPNDYTYLFKFADYLIRTEVLDKELLGVDILTTYIQKVGKSNETFSNWMMSSDLIDYLIKSDLHVEVVKRIQPIVKFCSKKQKISLQMIEALYDKAAVTHKSEIEPMYYLIVSAFKGFDNKTIIDFVQKHNSDNLFLSILMEKAKNMDLLRYCVITLLKNESKGHLLSRLNKNIRAIIIEYVNQNFKSQNLTYLQEILPDLISTSKNAVKEFDEHINLIVRDYAGKEDTQEFVLLILKAYLVKTKGKTHLSIVITKQLFRCQNDKLFTFINDLLDEIGTDLFDDDSYKFIDQYLYEYDYSKVDSEKFVTFLNTYSYKSMEYHKQKESKSSDDSDFDENFDFLAFPQSFLPILMKAYFSINESSKSFTLIQTYLLDFFTQLSDDTNEIVSNVIDKAFIPYLDPSNKANTKSSNNEMKRSLALLIKLINKIEDGIYLEDFGLQRHKDEILYYPEITLDFGGTKKIIHQDLEVPCSALLKRIKTFTKSNNYPNNYYYQNYKLKVLSRGKEIEKTKLLSLLHDTNFTVKNSGKFLKKKMLSIELFEKHQLADKLFELFNNQSIDKSVLDLAWELIQLLPSLKDVNIDLHSCKSEYLLRYSLELISLDKSFNNYSLLVDLLVSRKLKQSDLFIMNVILRLFNDDFVPYFPKMCKIILAQFKDQKDDKMIVVPAQLMRRMSKKYDGSDKILLQYVDDVVTMLFSVKKETIQPIIRTIDSIKNLKQIFDKSIEKVGTISDLDNKDYIVRGLFELYNSHPKDVNSKKLINSVMNITNSISLDTLITIINIFLETSPDDKSNLKKFIFENLLSRIYKEDNPNEFDSYLKLKKYYSDIDSPLEKLILSPETKFKAFNVKPPTVTADDENADNNEFRGIYNMGVTCFMNSTLQQLFFTFPFRYLVLTTEKDKLLYNIFSELILPNKGALSMKKYVTDIDQIISTDSQQDAYEFYQLLLDKQNEECQSIFKGTLINHIEGINNDYSSINKEDFTGIDLTVEEKNNLFESFETYCDNEYFSLGDNKDVRKYIRIGKAPQALVIQLKRFKYDFETFRRNKINSRFEFPQSFDMAPYMDDPNVGHKIYELFGVVIHSGCANSGHYFSLIKLNDKWYEFNDNDVHEFPEEKFEKVTFGSEQSQKSGYLLFYHEKDAVFNDNDVSIRYDQIPDPSLSTAILNNLNKDSPHYCLFTDSFLQFAINASLQFQMYYFFKVFLHSAMNSDLCDKFISKVTSNLKSTKNSKKDDSLKAFSKLAVDEIDSFIGMLIKCKSEDIKNSSILLIESIAENKYSFDFYNVLIQNLDPFIVEWDKLPSVSQILLKVVPIHAKKAKASNWDKKITDFIQKFYKEASDKAKKSINFTDFFEILRILKADDLSVLESNFKSIILSPSNSTILTLLNTKQKSTIMSLFSNSDSYVQFVVQSTFPSEKDEESDDEEEPNKVSKSSSTNTNNIDFFVDSLFENPNKKMKKSDITKSLCKELKTSNSSSFKDMLIDNYGKLILPLFFDSNSDVRTNAENITYQLFDEIGPLDFTEDESSDSSTDNYYYNLTKQQTTPPKTSKSFQDFGKKLPDLVNKSISLINDNYSNQGPMIINFLNILLWSANQIDVFDMILSIYQIVKKKNDKETVPDINFIDVTSTLRKCLVFIDNEVFHSKHEKNLIPVIYQLFKYGGNDQTSEILFKLLTYLSMDSLINVYKSKEFLSFFKKETKLKKSEESFNKSYNLNRMFENVISESDDIANMFIKYVIVESNLEDDHMTITLIIDNKIKLVPNNLYLASINYVIDCAIDNADFDLFRKTIDVINTTFQEKIESDFDFSGIDDKRLLDSFVFLRGSNAKSKRFYGEFISNVCSKNENLAKIVLQKLFEIISQMTNSDKKEYRYYILTCLNVIGKTNKFEYYDQFVKDIIPLVPISFWTNTDRNIFMTFTNDNYDDLPDSKSTVAKIILSEMSLRKANNSTITFITNYIKNTPIEKLNPIIQELSQDEQNPYLQANWGYIINIRPELDGDDDESSD